VTQPAGILIDNQQSAARHERSFYLRQKRRNIRQVVKNIEHPNHA
jgi:hypothetical protein